MTSAETFYESINRVKGLKELVRPDFSDVLSSDPQRPQTHLAVILPLDSQRTRNPLNYHILG
jgi:hypothetical protein